jgi:exosome complex RNA-binding protein Rrp4
VEESEEEHNTKKINITDTWKAKVHKLKEPKENRLTLKEYFIHQIKTNKIMPFLKVPPTQVPLMKKLMDNAYMR